MPGTIVPSTWPDFHASIAQGVSQKVDRNDLDGLTRVFGPRKPHHQQSETSTEQDLADPVELHT